MAEVPQQLDQVAKFRTAVNQIYGIVMALAITNSTQIFATQASSTPANYPPMPADFSTWVAFIFSTVLILRFFFGNIAHLNSDKDNNIVEVAFDSSVILIQAVLISYATYFITDLSKFIVIVNILFSVDLLWYGVSWAVVHYFKKEMDVDKSVHASQFLTVLTLVLFWILNFDDLGWKFYNIFVSVAAKPESVLIAYLVVNTSLDIYLNRYRYLKFRNSSAAENE